MMKRLEFIEDFAGEAFAVRIDFPMTGAPTFQEAVEISPSDGEEDPPFGFYGSSVEFWMFNRESPGEGGKVMIEDFGFS